MLKLRKLLFLFPISLFIWNEFLIYYIFFLKCKWPEHGKDSLKAFMISDTHLLGPFRGHWFDKLRREWQMWRSFQTSLTLLSPDVTFFLGDIFDEGQWSNEKGFERYISRFDELFRVSKNTERYVVVGNHDIGFHDYIHPQRESWFGKTYPNSTPVGVIELKNETFVLVNSMAMHGDYCRLCHMAEMEIKKISNKLKSGIKQPRVSNGKEFIKKQKQPTVLMHFPLYRNNDMNCEGGNELNDFDTRKSEMFREKWDCLSKNATQFIIDRLNPKVVFSGHTHYGCKIKYDTFTEYTVASFSWRNNPMPSFLLVVYDNDNVKVNICFIPHENIIIFTYIISVLLIVIYLFYVYYKRNFVNPNFSNVKYD